MQDIENDERAYLQAVLSNVPTRETVSILTSTVDCKSMFLSFNQRKHVHEQNMSQ
jgi:hypothetical protein